MADTAVRQAIYSMGLDNSAYVQKAQQTASANEKMVGSLGQVAAAEEKVTVATRTTADGFAKLEARYDPLIRAEQRRQAALQQANRYLQEGAIAQDRYLSQVARVNSFYDQQIVQLGRLQGANNNAVGGMNRFRGSIQNAGFQVGDFAVQLASGQNAMVAFTQQGSQLLQVFGVWGAVLGAAVSVIGAVAIGLFKMGDASKDAAKATDTYREAEEKLNDVLLTSQERADQLAAKRHGNAIQAAKDAIETQRVIIKAAQEQLELQERIAALSQPGDTAEAGQLALAGSVLSPPRDAKGNRTTVQQLLSDLNTAQERIDDLQASLDRLDDPAQSGASRDTAAKAAKKAADETKRQREEFDRMLDREIKAADAVNAANNKRNVSVEKYIDGLENAASVEEMSGTEKKVQLATIAAQNKLIDEQGNKLRDLTETERERIANAVRTKDAIEEQAKAAEKVQKELEHAIEKGTDRATDKAADILYDGFSGRITDVGDLLRTTLLRAAADVAAQMIFRPLIQPIMAAAVGGAPGLFGVSSAGGSPAAGGGFDFLNAGSTLFSAGNQLGMFGAGLGGISTAIDTFGASAFGLSSVAGGGNTLAGLSGVEMGSVDAGFIAGEGSALGGASLSSILGGVGLGFGAGTLLNSLVGGNSTNGMIGAGGGALAGAIIGSVIPGIGTILGGLLGGSGGGLLGGMFGPSHAFSGGQINLAADSNGQLVTTEARLKRFQDDQAKQAAAQFVGQVNANLARLGLRLTPQGNFTNIAFGEGAHAIDETVGRLFTAGGIQSGFSDLDARIRGLDTSGGADAAFGRLNELVATFKAIEAIKGPSGEAADALKLIKDQFDALAESARKYGLDVATVEKGRQDALDRYRMTVAQPYLQAAGGIVDFLNAQSLSPQSSLSPLGRLSEAQRQFGNILEQVRGGNVSLTGNLTQSANNLLGIGRDLYGSTSQGAALESMVRSSLLSVSELFSSDSFIDKQVAAIGQQTQVQQQGFKDMVDAVERLKREIVLLRGEIREAA